MSGAAGAGGNEGAVGVGVAVKGEEEEVIEVVDVSFR